jgi:hypothetical protein
LQEAQRLLLGGAIPYAAVTMVGPYRGAALVDD